MKGKLVDKCKHQLEWERMLQNNKIYLGDHMTRAWVKDGEDQEVTGQKMSVRRRPSVKCAHKIANDSLNEHHNSRISRCSRRKFSTGKRRLKVEREVLARHKITKQDFHEWQGSFDALLNSEAGCQLFKVFLESEIADENLKFWLACEELKKNKQKSMDKRVQDIYDTYIDVFSPHEINIDYKLRESIVDQLKHNPDASVFSEAQHQVYRLMHRDSYPRFLSSPIATELIAALSAKQDTECRAKKPKDDTMSISELILCCYLRRWSIDDSGFDTDEPTVATQTPLSEVVEGSSVCEVKSTEESLPPDSISDSTSNNLKLSKSSEETETVSSATFLSDSDSIELVADNRLSSKTMRNNITG